MSKVDFQAGFREHAKAGARQFVHDRTKTIGASEAGNCERQLFFSKRRPELADVTPEVTTDPDELEDYTDDWGHTTRGRVMEDHFIVPALISMFGADNCLYMGDDQHTFVDGRISATPDGLVVGAADDALALYGVPSLGGSECFNIEAKTFHAMTEPPRSSAKPKHILQTRIQAKLIGAKTNYRPRVGVVLYVNSVDYEDIRPRVVQMGDDADAAYKSARAKAERVYDLSLDAKDFLPEGLLAGTDCTYCKFNDACAAVELGKVPDKSSAEALTDEQKAHVEHLVRDLQKAKNALEDMTKRVRRLTQDVQDSLSALGKKKVEGPDWSASMYVSKGRRTVDKKAMADAGIDLTPFEKEGSAFVVLRTAVDK